MASRPPAYYELSGYGTHYLDLATALEYPDRARAVSARESDLAGLSKLARLMRLELHGATLPANIGAFEHLRVLKWRGCPAALPAAVVALPALRELYLEDSAVADVSALGSAGPNLSTICVWRTPLSEDAAGLERQLAALAGWNPGGFLKRTPAPAVPATKAALAAAIRANTLPDGSDLTGRDLSGEVFEDIVLVSTKLCDADLSNTTFRRCDLSHLELDGANLTGARFDGCRLELQHREATKVNATKMVISGGAVGLHWKKSTLVDARIEELEVKPRLTIVGCDARRMQLTYVAFDPKSHDLDLSKSDLRGAQVRIDIRPELRAALEKTPNPRLKWVPVNTDGTKVDEDTVIEYVALPAKQKPEKKPAAKKPAAEKPAAKAEKPAAKKSAAKKPAAKKPAPKKR